MNIAHILAVAAVLYGSAFGLYVLFLSYCTLRQMKATGRLAAMPALAKGHCYALLYFIVLWDVLFNVTVGTVVFLDLPRWRQLTFTARCERWLLDFGCRGDIARWVCNGWLNPGEPGHCK